MRCRIGSVRIMRRLQLSATVFVCGAVVLILEILGSRLLAPFFGSTIFVWSSLIAVTMLALAAGYSLGGRLADRTDPLPALYRLLVVAGWLILLIPFWRIWVLPAASRLGLRAGALAAAFFLIGPPLAVLGSVAPLAAKTAVADLGELGARVGGLYAVSTFGSLAGALAAGFILIPGVGVIRVLFISALLCFAPAAWFWAVSRVNGRKFWLALAAAGSLLCLAGLAKWEKLPVRRGEWVLIEKEDTHYTEAKVAQFRTARVLLLDGTMQTGLDLTGGGPIFSYACGVAGLLTAAQPGAKRVLLVGLGGGVLAGMLAARGMKVETVEIDPVVARMARERFGLSPGVPVTIGDGRLFLARSGPATYDAVIMDAYAGEAPPMHMFTVSAVRLIARALKPGGVGLANLICEPGGLLSRAAGATLSSVFPWVSAYAMDDSAVTNVIFVFGDRPRRLTRIPDFPVLPMVAAQVKGLLQRRVELGGPGARPLTDDYNPMETLGLAARERMRKNVLALLPTWLLLE